MGQNFLVDRSVADRIIALLEDNPPRVIEIGPGRGALTEPLLGRFADVRALEIDEELIGPLERRFAADGLHVIHGDGVTIPLDDIAVGGDAWQVVSNLPYSVGTAILRRLMPRHDLFSRLVVMLQHEVAERVVAEPGDGNHGLMALERAAWAEARLAFSVAPRAFRPVPKVQSAVLVLDPRSPAADRVDIDRALALAARALTRPRKMLPNALGGAVTGDVIARAGIDPSTRPGMLCLDDWLRLSAVLVSE
jgi:16S rRNA (adenine1518-N6/adenine1519-N6)-dimethyltransferase